MEWIQNGDLGRGSEEFIHALYQAMDDATALGLDRLRREDGIVPTCSRGCSCCCRYHIPTNIAEARILVQYIKRELSAEQISDLEMRTRLWHQWDDSQPGRHRWGDSQDPVLPSDYDPCCPLLVDGVCSVYPVRPVVCRIHFVSSDPSSCCAAIHPDSAQNVPVVLKSLVAAAKPHSKIIQDHIESAGIDFSRSIMLLPHWLAIEMEWDFALTL